MKFIWTTIGVTDMARSLAFYRDIVGLPVAEVMKPGPGLEITFLGSGETRVELIRSADARQASFAANISLGFEVGSLDQTMAFLREKGVEVLAGPFQPAPHIRFLYVLDPDGLRIQFVERLTAK